MIAKMLSQEQVNEDDLSDEEDSFHLRDTNHTQEMVHAALKIRMDLQDTPGHSAGWGGIDNEHVADIVPNSLFLFLSVLFGGISALTQETVCNDENAILSIAQYIVYGVSKKRKLTPKHIGLALTLHQATRSATLVDLFHVAGHTIGMDTVRRIDTSIATEILETFKANGYVFIPRGIVPYTAGRLIIGSLDNIDVQEETIDGKNTFHSTQLVCWQRGPAGGTPMNSKIGREKALKKDQLERLHQLDRAKVYAGNRPTPVFANDSMATVEEMTRQSGEAKKSHAMNLIWVLSRYESSNHQVPSWTAFNETCSTNDPPVTTIGVLPILQAHADQNDTVVTVINRFRKMNHSLGQKYTIIAGDQPLYSRGKELIWANQEDYGDVIMLLGGLHVSFNFLKVIGQHMENAGLDDILVEAGILAEKSVSAAMDGKAYYRAVRAHTLAYEALQRMKWMKFQAWLQMKERSDGIDKKKILDINDMFINAKPGFHQDISTSAQELANTLLSEQFESTFNDFNKEFTSDPSVAFWNDYIEMVETLLDFIRAHRDGNWQLHLDSFAAMLPWMTLYDHTNYARWGTVYLADMKCLPQEVKAEFEAGNFVCKKTRHRFNQVPFDQATEWMNRLCKTSQGIIGITRNDSARDRFCTTWSERSQISLDTKSMFGMDAEEDAISTMKDGLPSRVKQDEEAVKQLIAQFERFHVLDISTPYEPVTAENDATQKLIAATTKDVATEEITKALLNAKARGEQLLADNIRARIEEKTTPFFSVLKKNKPLTFASMYKMTVTSEQKEVKVVKADRKLMQQLLNATRAGRHVELESVLQHELSQFPLSFAGRDGKMNTTSKSDILGIITTDQGVNVTAHIPDSPHEESTRTCVLIDGHALIQSTGKPRDCNSFNEYANHIIGKITKYFGGSTTRVDVVFDRYIGSQSIKNSTRVARTGTKKPIRRLINDGETPLPQVWDQFVCLDENKAELASFLTRRLIAQREYLQQFGWEIVCSGGEEKARSSEHGVLEELTSDQEEADTRIILHTQHAKEFGFNRFIVICKDTDVLLLLLFHFRDVEIWMLAGKKAYPVHSIASKLQANVLDSLLGFHAFTGSDTTSSLKGYGKKTCWKIFQIQPNLLAGVGRDGDLLDVQKFLCLLYKVPQPADDVNQARYQIFVKGQKPLECLPPTIDALELHFDRSNHQAKIWIQANRAQPDVGNPLDTNGWVLVDGALNICWSRIPAVPAACLELSTCGCKTKCKTAACKCVKNNQKCMPACGCDADGCCNPNMIGDSDDD
jgi:hypothetical protein